MPCSFPSFAERDANEIVSAIMASDTIKDQLFDALLGSHRDRPMPDIKYARRNLW
jgi:hypothetical protein